MVKMSSSKDPINFLIFDVISSNDDSNRQLDDLYNTEEYNDFPEWATQIYDDTDEENIDFSEELNESEVLTDKLVSWAVKFNISQTACSNLLGFLNKLHPDLPKDARSLLSTQRSVNIQNVAGGEYFYFSLQYWLSIFT